MSILSLITDAAHFSALVAMDSETYADKIPHPPAAIPLTDSEHNILPLQFVVDPGQDMDWNITDEIIKRLTLSEKDKLNLLSEYFNLKNLKIPLTKNDLLIEKESGKLLKTNVMIEKSRTLPCSFESDDNSSTTTTTCASASSVGHSSSIKSKVFSTKTAKQLLMITKHFGSLGRMSKRIKKNLGTLARRGTSFRFRNRNSIKKIENGKVETNSDKIVNGENKQVICHNGFYNDPDSIITAVLHTEKRHEYHDEMIRNYLNTARARFLRQQREKKSQEKQNKESPKSSLSSNSTSTSTSSTISMPNNVNNTVSMCVNPGCKMYGSADTNYLCSSCFTDQKNELIKNGINKNSDCDITKSKELKHIYDSPFEDDVKKPLNKETEDCVITCANSHFYVTT